MNDLNFEPMPAWNPCLGQRMAPAWKAIVKALYAAGEGGAVTHPELVEAALAARGVDTDTGELLAPLAAKSIDKLISEGRNHGYLAGVVNAYRPEDRKYRLTKRARMWLDGTWIDQAA